MAELVAPPRRSSDADRDRTVRRLRDAAVDGRLSHDSFVRRVHIALQAKDEVVLARLVIDLPSRGLTTGLRTAWTALVGHRSTINATPPALPLPTRERPVMVVGRGADCDLVLADPTVSRVHAVLMLFGGHWFIHDRRSTNGTQVNGRRIGGDTVIEPGDVVALGRMTFRVVAPAS